MKNKKDSKTLAEIAIQNGVNTAEIIDPHALALRLILKGLTVSNAANICGVGRQYLHKLINEATKKSGHKFSE